jgi:diadenosine tetraphosphate (Ap4A) HIT family hydrolase
VADWREHRIGSAHRGENPMVMARMRSGSEVIGDTQHLPGYSLLLCDDASVHHLTDLDWPLRAAFLFDLSLVGEAVHAARRADGLRRVNYEVLDNWLSWLHGHVHPRYVWEPFDRIGWPVCRYPEAERNVAEHAYRDDKHGELRSCITRELERLMATAYGDAAQPRSEG